MSELESLYTTTPKCINSKQAIGLKYYRDLATPIPRSEMDAYAEALLTLATQLNPAIQLSINGSYRRRCSTSGDIDVLISVSDPAQNPSQVRSQFITLLRKQGIIMDTLANGKKKFMGVCRLLPRYTVARHIDIIDTTMEEFPFSVLYFTGSGPFNASMRGQALDQGYSLNEFTLSHKATKKPVTPEEVAAKLGKPTFENEQDIFAFLGLDYVEPWDRT